MGRIAPTYRSAGALDAIRLQAEEHPLIEDARPVSAREHVLRLMHLRAYEEAKAYAAGRDVLDVGCNTGYGTMALAAVARRTVGVDVSPRAIEQARLRPGADGVEFVVVDGSVLPFADRTFDVVTSFQVLEHVVDALPYIGEIIRVSRPGATAIFTTPNAAIRLDPGMTPWNRFHVREYRAAELQDLLAPLFHDVRVLGMFGHPELYDAEIARTARSRARRRRDMVEMSPDPRGGRRRGDLLRRIARALPRRRRGSAGRPVGASIADLHYQATDVDRSMDLMAICTVAGTDDRAGVAR